MIKIITIVGARPQFVKAAVLSRYINKHNNKRQYNNIKNNAYKNIIENKNYNNHNNNIENNTLIKEIIIHTGQHYDKNMSDTFFKQMDIPEPDINLGLGGGNHGEMTGRMMIEFEKIVLKEKPDFIVIYGDTNSTLAGALVGAKLHIPVVHIEAGLRSFDKSMPEEINRVVSDHVSKYLFCPTETAIKNLKKEGIYDGKEEKGHGKVYVKNVGDIMYEAFNYYKEKIKDDFKPGFYLHKFMNLKEINDSYNFNITDFNITKNNGLFNFLDVNDFNLLTLHRDFNVDNEKKLKTILKALSKTDKFIVFPVHPRTANRIEKFNLLSSIGNNFILLEPVGYFEMLWLELHSDKIITDSGGVQKEAYFAKKPCITLREHTEWIELVDIGANVLCSIEENEIIEKVNNFKCNKETFNKNLYGDGKVAEKIIKILKKRV